MHADVIIEVPFHDVDTMNVVWHGHYLKYFEIARCKLLDQFHYNYNQMRDSGYAWPVIESHVRYVQGIEFEQKIRVRAILKEWENRLKIEYLIFDVVSGRKLTKGYTSQVAVHIEKREMCFQSPQVLLDCLKAWPEFKAE
ncbi:acyl-CoA thioesterase [Acinetobacter johnsonii]|jgi:acyl-CoA thioester hydrolase|uniref:acyl-CoA thioesterase n=1 Tax=Acinetobacter TaxID=469 RepID=UPI00143BE538|nr:MULTISPECIES: acyl-CoA thioesterase [Acinetobacter]MDD0802424.1 acyl-CoA thioesterase [Acinetobacter sp. Gutcm_16]NKG38737.1 4-hydroxybenzoyl-CoA thioesterase [Acinetobacter johnsonii]QPF35178.1 acyl-CoA thioesterase [Acinetobacter johnsonii]UJA05883.1 acyl-CoA thioesterase [Acinetobacter johnsonii]